MGFLDKIFGSHSERELKRLEKTVKAVMDLEAEYRQLTDEQLVAAGIEPGLVRLSVGLENVEDIIADLDQALAQLD